MEGSFEEKTEQATPRKRREAREKGDVARSTEVNSVIVLFVGLLALRVFGGRILAGITSAFHAAYGAVPTIEITTSNLPSYCMAGMGFLALLVAPVILCIMVAGVGAGILQSGFLMTSEPLKPKLSKISPAKGLKRIFSARSGVELAKSLFKMAIVGLIGYATLKAEFAAFPLLVEKDAIQIVGFVGGVGFKLAMRVCVVMIVLAALDWAYQKAEFEKKLRMTKQEVKEEHKRMEGDPLVKSRIRSIQMKQARQRMLSDVPEATVVVTNPTHLAVALKYDSDRMTAPVVVAKGARLLAEKIKQVATLHDVPIVENKPLARMMYKSVEVGAPIPLELYKAVAEILAYVYRLRGQTALSAG